MVQSVCEGQVPLSAVLDGDGADGLDERDAALARAIVRTTVRRHGDIDWILSQLIARPLPRKASFVRALLRISAAQLLFMRQADHAAVNVAVDLLKGDGATAGFSGLVNAVLRRLIREREALIAALPADANTPSWLYSRWQAHHGAAAAHAITEMARREPPIDICLRPECVVPAAGTPFPGGARLSATAVETIDGYADGDWWVQDFAAQLPVRLLGPVAGLQVLDMCAAPGGKTMQLAAAGASVVAVEQDPARAARLTENLARTGLSDRVDVQTRDARTVEGEFDAVLLDAPCSATGTIRRQPDVAWSKSVADINALTHVQQDLLRHGAGLVRRGGLLVYATCSLEPEEGERQLDFVASAVPALALKAAEDPIARSFALPEGGLRTLPHMSVPQTALKGMDGFFAAVFRRE